MSMRYIPEKCRVLMYPTVFEITLVRNVHCVICVFTVYIMWYYSGSVQILTSVKAANAMLFCLVFSH